jgi:hypothetical protein
MASGFDFYCEESGSLLDHDRYIALFLPAVGILNGCGDVHGSLHIGRPVLGAPNCMSSRWQGPSGVLSGYLEMSNISAGSMEAQCLSYRLPFREFW